MNLSDGPMVSITIPVWLYERVVRLQKIAYPESDPETIARGFLTFAVAFHEKEKEVSNES